jgi:hypothetical protein
VADAPAAAGRRRPGAAGAGGQLVPRSAETPIQPATAENPPQPDRFDEGGAQPGRQHTPTPIEQDTADAFANDTPGPNAASAPSRRPARARFLNEPPGQQARHRGRDGSGAPAGVHQGAAGAGLRQRGAAPVRHRPGGAVPRPGHGAARARPVPEQGDAEPERRRPPTSRAGRWWRACCRSRRSTRSGTVGFMAAGGVLRRLPGANRWLLGRLTSFVERQQKLDGFQVVEGRRAAAGHAGRPASGLRGRGSGRGAAPRPGLVRVGDLANAAENEARNAVDVIHGLVDSGQISVEDGQRLAASAARSYLDTAARDGVKAAGNRPLRPRASDRAPAVGRRSAAQRGLGGAAAGYGRAGPARAA